MRRSFEYTKFATMVMRRSFELEKYEYMNKLPRSGVWAPAQTPLPHSPPGKGESGVWAPRSEERRVGKECRSRWSPYH